MMKNKSNILIISHLYPSKKNPTKGIFVHKQALALKKSGLEVQVISPKVILKEKSSGIFEMDGIPVTETGYWSFGKRFSFVTGLTGYLGAKRIIENIKKPDLILAHTALPDGGIAQRISKKLKVPYFVYVHGADVQHKIHHNRITKNKITMVLSGAKKVFVNSSKTQRLVKELGVSSVVIPMGVDAPNVKHITKNTKMLKIISVCNLEKEKGVQYVIEALRKIKDKNLKYIIIGEGSHQAELQKLARGDKRIKFLGRLSQEKVFKNLSKADIFVMPSYNDAYGVAYLEAMSFGLPVIGVKGEGIEDILAKGKCGILIKPQDAPSVQNALERLIKDRDLRINMGKTGENIIQKYYRWDIIADSLKKELGA